MSSQASFSLRGRNPDVLTCIANLSNDEVFTPPELANGMLDTLAEAWAQAHDGASIWTDSAVRFLDPCTKSGVFLREITSRLTKGLATEIPDLGKRVNHILAKQVFGIGTTQLTSLLARRSVYCSKHANGKHSIAKSLALFKICVEAYPASPIPAQPRSQFAEFCATPLLSSVWNHAR